MAEKCSMNIEQIKKVVFDFNVQFSFVILYIFFFFFPFHSTRCATEKVQGCDKLYCHAIDT